MDINPQDRVGPRLDELEIKASYTEDLLDQLNLTIFRQQQQIDRLTQQVAQLKDCLLYTSPSPRD